MPNKDMLKAILADKQQQFQELLNEDDLDAAYEVNQDISDIMLALYS